MADISISPDVIQDEKKYEKISHETRKQIESLKKSNLKQSVHEILEVKDKITELNEIITILNRKNSERIDIPEIDRIKRDDIISKIKQDIVSFEHEYNHLNVMLTNFDEKKYYKNLTDRELREQRDLKEKKLHSKFVVQRDVAKEIKGNAREMRDVLDQDALLVEKQNSAVSNFMIKLR